MSTPSQDLRELVEQAQSGDRGAWDRLYELYERELNGRVRSKLGPQLRDDLDSADLMQSVWLEAFRSLENFEYRGDASFLNWVSGILRHKLSRKARTVHRTGARVSGEAGIEILDRQPAEQAGPSTEVRRKDEVQVLREALKLIDADSRRILRMSWFDERDHHEIAEQLGVSSDAVRMRIARAETKLEQAFLRLGGSPSL